MNHYNLLLLLALVSLCSASNLFTLIGTMTSCNATCKLTYSPTGTGTITNCNSSITGTVPMELVFNNQQCADICSNTTYCQYFKTTTNTDTGNSGNAVNCIVYLPIFTVGNQNPVCAMVGGVINLGFYQKCSSCVTCDHSGSPAGCISSPQPSTVAQCGVDYSDSSVATQYLLEHRQLETVRLVEELGNVNMNALDKIMMTDGIYNPNGTLNSDFCNLVEVVLNQQQNRSAMSIFIDNFYSCDYCQFVSTWHNLARLYAYRKRFKANFVLMNYSDVNCVRGARYYSIAGHFGQINYLPGNQSQFNTTFTGPLWHTTYNFFDTDRFQIQWTEVSYNNYKIVAMIQQTEGSWALGDDLANSGFLGPNSHAGAGRSPLPFDQGGPGDLPLPVPDISNCPSYAANCMNLPPRSTACPTTFTL